MPHEKFLCECGNEIPEARQKTLASIGGTNRCTECQEKAEKEEAKNLGVKHLPLRPIVAAKAFVQLGNHP